ncbi:TPA: flavodoxin family protein [Candidatus Bathyarchaeota archaeon]|nr:flavodoxin family protein [Candidatus Bathyarchaeota archaeon]
MTSVLGVAGSPRRGGNTETLLDEVLRGAAEAGAMTEKVVLAERDVKSCRACNACARTKVCIQKDDMVSIIEKMREAEVWVLATPVYWWGPTAQMKAFIDRWYSIPRDVFRGKRVILAVSSGGGSPYSDLMVRTFGEIFAYLDMEEFRVLQTGGADSKTTARGDEHLMRDAHAAGFDAVKTLRV